MRTRIGFALVAALTASLLGGGMQAGAEGMPGCATPDHPGGDWTMYGHDQRNTRSQPLEDVINAGNVANLAPVEVWNPAQTGALNAGGFSNTPIVADGCVYVATNTGYVFALNADTLEPVWDTPPRFRGEGQLLLGGVIVGSPLVRDGVVYVGVSDPGVPYVAAIDQATGEILWRSYITGWRIRQNPAAQSDSHGYREETRQPQALINASPVWHDGMIFMGFSGNEGTPAARGGFALVDASPACENSATVLPGEGVEGQDITVHHIECANPTPGGTGGTVLKHTYTITDAEYEAGYRGASIWCTAAVDADTHSIYACGGNPASKRQEARLSNSLFRIDADRSSPTFGEITHAYKGETDQYFPGLDRQPVCDAFGDDLVYVAWSAACLQLDLDFGSSPNLWTDHVGRTVVGALQKSGVYHATFGDNMQRAWTQVVGGPGFPFNAGSTAIDDEQVFIASQPVGLMVSVTQHQGRYRWAAPIGDQVSFHATSYANGVVYTTDTLGFLNAFDAQTGLPLVRRPLHLDVGAPVSDSGSIGIAIARNTLYVAYSTYIIAYR